METVRIKFKEKNVEGFKSYYVVWKLYCGFNDIIHPLCLNRTMQYGNKFRAIYFFVYAAKFKSYYVVWKP